MCMVYILVNSVCNTRTTIPHHTAAVHCQIGRWQMSMSMSMGVMMMMVVMRVMSGVCLCFTLWLCSCATTLV